MAEEGAVRWIVDGMNLIGSRPDGWWRDRPTAMRDLVGRLGSLRAATGEAITVVLDGRAVEVPRVEGVEVIFAGSGGPNAADRRIAALVSDDPDPSSMRVVTSDRELADRVKAAGAAVVSSGSFRRRLGEPTRPACPDRPRGPS